MSTKTLTIRYSKTQRTRTLLLHYWMLIARLKSMLKYPKPRWKNHPLKKRRQQEASRPKRVEGAQSKFREKDQNWNRRSKKKLTCLSLVRFTTKDNQWHKKSKLKLLMMTSKNTKNNKTN